MAGSYIYAWDAVNSKWVKVLVTDEGKLKVKSS